MPLLTRQSTYTGGSRLIVEIFDSMHLQANRNYTATVSVQDKDFDGMIVSNTTKFSKYILRGVGVEWGAEPLHFCTVYSNTSYSNTAWVS